MRNFITANKRQQERYDSQITSGIGNNFEEQSHTEYSRISKDWLEMLNKAKVNEHKKSYEFRFKPKKSNHKIMKNSEIMSISGFQDPLLRIIEQYQNSQTTSMKVFNDHKKQKQPTTTEDKQVDKTCANILNLNYYDTEERKERKSNSFSINEVVMRKTTHFPQLNYQEHRQDQIYSAYLPNKEKIKSKHFQYMKMKQMNQREEQEKKKIMILDQPRKIPKFQENSYFMKDKEEIQKRIINKNLIIESNGGFIRPEPHKKQHTSAPVSVKRSLPTPYLWNHPFADEKNERKEKFIESKDDDPSIAAKIQRCISFKNQTKKTIMRSYIKLKNQRKKERNRSLRSLKEQS